VFANQVAVMSQDLSLLILGILDKTPYQNWGSLTPKIIREGLENQLSLVRIVPIVTCKLYGSVSTAYLQTGTRSLEAQKSRNCEHNR